MQQALASHAPHPPHPHKTQDNSQSLRNRGALARTSVPVNRPYPAGGGYVSAPGAGLRYTTTSGTRKIKAELAGIDFLEPNFFRNGHVHFATFDDPRGLTSTGNGNRMPQAPGTRTPSCSPGTNPVPAGNSVTCSPEAAPFRHR